LIDIGFRQAYPAQIAKISLQIHKGMLGNWLMWRSKLTESNNQSRHLAISSDFYFDLNHTNIDIVSSERRVSQPVLGSIKHLRG
jgi:hypothetical protein